MSLVNISAAVLLLAASAAAGSWSKTSDMSDTRCVAVLGSGFLQQSSLAVAQSKCDEDITCAGVEDYWCNNDGDYGLCQASLGFRDETPAESHEHSCVYLKPDAPATDGDALMVHDASKCLADGNYDSDCCVFNNANEPDRVEAPSCADGYAYAEGPSCCGSNCNGVICTPPDYTKQESEFVTWGNCEQERFECDSSSSYENCKQEAFAACTGDCVAVTVKKLGGNIYLTYTNAGCVKTNTVVDNHWDLYTKATAVGTDAAAATTDSTDAAATTEVDECGVMNGNGVSCACDEFTKRRELKVCVGRLCHEAMDGVHGHHDCSGKGALNYVKCQAYIPDCSLVHPDEKAYKMRKCLKQKKKCVDWGFLKE